MTAQAGQKATGQQRGEEMSAVGRKVLKRHTRVQAHAHTYTRTHGPPLPVDPHDAPSPAQGGPPAPTWNTQPPRGCSHRTLFSPRPPPEGRTLKFLLPGPLVRGKCAQSNARTPPQGNTLEHAPTSALRRPTDPYVSRLRCHRHREQTARPRTLAVSSPVHHLLHVTLG